MFETIKKIFFDIRVSWTLMIIFLISFLIYLGTQGAFKDKKGKDGEDAFFHFGTDDNTKFFNMTLDSWDKVGLVYFFCFIISWMSQYYEAIMDFTIYSTVWNPAYKDPMPISKPLTYLFLLSDTFIWWLQKIIVFYVMSIKQFQFLIPTLLGKILAKWPYAMIRINEKKYI